MVLLQPRSALRSKGNVALLRGGVADETALILAQDHVAGSQPSGLPIHRHCQTLSGVHLPAVEGSLFRSLYRPILLSKSSIDPPNAC